MSPSLSARSLIFSAVAFAFFLTGCGSIKPSTTTPENHENMVYIPPSTSSLVGRWVPKEDAGAPGVAATGGISATTIKTMQIEGLKNTPSSPSVSQK